MKPIRSLRSPILLLPFLVLSAGSPARGAAPTNDDCLGCHEDATLQREADKSAVAVDRAKWEASIHGGGGIACVDCHADLATFTDFPHPPKLQPVSCAKCHDAIVKEYSETVHAHARKDQGNLVAATCIDCHGKHDILPRSDPASRTYPLNVPATCAACHGNAEKIAKGHIAAGDVASMFQDSIHGEALIKKGLIIAPDCARCHGAHAIRKASDPESRVHRSHIPATCGSCHEGLLKQYEKSVHGVAVGKGNPKAPVCTDCHSAHQIAATVAEGWRLDVMKECGTCHAESLHSYRDTYHGQVSSLGFARVATCADCHGSHGILPSSDPRSTISDARRAETCRKCHPKANENFARYDPHADPRDKERYPLVHWTTFFMKWLLAGTFTFFGIHTLLWFPRSLSEARKHRLGHGKRDGDES
jgi:nitrate/TMAO reductase-like tetraheme cytochrome c subunit